MALIFYTPCLPESGANIEKMLSYIESKFNDQKIKYSVDNKGKVLELADRKKFITEAIQLDPSDIPLICNGDDEKYFGVNIFKIPKEIGPGKEELFQVNIEFDDELYSIYPIVDLVLDIGDCLSAFHGGFSPKTSSSILWKQLSQNSPLGLPKLKKMHEIDNPVIPVKLDWINYWSEKTIKFLNYSNNINNMGAFLIKSSKKNNIVIQLTKCPLDFRNENHLTLIQSIYKQLAFMTS